MFKLHTNRTKRCVSVLDGAGRALSHETCVKALNCTFSVSESGLRRFRQTQHRTVFAFVVAESWEVATLPTDTTGFTSVSFNPFVNDTFVNGNQPIFEASELYFHYDSRQCAIWSKP